MKIATRNTIAAALAVALAGMGMPVAALAANAAEDTAATAVAADAADDVMLVEDDGDFIRNGMLSDFNGKWFRYKDGIMELNGADATVKYKIVVKDGKMDCYVDGTGTAGRFFPVPACCKKYKYTGTLYVGAGITCFPGGNYDCYAPAYKVRFAEGSQLREVGPDAFSEAKSINLEACAKLEKIDHHAFDGSTAKIVVPPSVTEIGDSAFANVKNVVVQDPENTSIPPSAFGGKSSVAVVGAPKVKVASPNKATVTWSAPYTTSISGGKINKKAVSYAVKYKVQYRVKGDKTWKKTGYTSGKAKTLTMLAKGKKYQVRVTAYKKSGSKWKALTTSTYKTSSAVKGYNPAPTLKAAKSSITASWSKVPGATSYKVYYRTGSGSWKAKTSKKASLKISGLAAGTKYQVKVRAYKGKSGICESTAKSATTAL